MNEILLNHIYDIIPTPENDTHFSIILDRIVREIMTADKYSSMVYNDDFRMEIGFSDHFPMPRWKLEHTTPI